MRFTFTSALALAVAAAALPSENNLSGQKHDQKHEMAVQQQKCGDLTVSCCTQVNIEGNGNFGQGEAGGLGWIVKDITGGKNTFDNTVCAPRGSDFDIDKVIKSLLGISSNEEFCNLPDISYACCNDAKECHTIPPNEKHSEEKKMEFGKAEY